MIIKFIMSVHFTAGHIALAELSNSSATFHLWCTRHITSIALHFQDRNQASGLWGRGY